MPFFHVWQADLAANHPEWPAAEATLSAAERARQARLRTPDMRRTYGRAHGFLRAVLSGYTSHSASQLPFTSNANGKPVLAESSLHFNLSYRPGRALLAVSNACVVGADVEPLLPLTDAAALIKELFSPAEQAALQAAEPADWHRLFYTIWTRKEAYAKALGMGLALPFAAFSVLIFQAGGPLAFIAPARSWLRSFELNAGYQGAVAGLGAGPEPVAKHFYYPTDLEIFAT